jgi:hypothetical protein
MSMQVRGGVRARGLMHRTWRERQENAIEPEPKSNQRQRNPGSKRTIHAKKVSARWLNRQLPPRARGETRFGQRAGLLGLAPKPRIDIVRCISAFADRPHD